MFKRLVAIALTVLLIGLLCWAQWGFFWVGVFWSLAVLLAYAFVGGVLAWFDDLVDDWRIS